MLQKGLTTTSCRAVHETCMYGSMEVYPICKTEQLYRWKSFKMIWSESIILQEIEKWHLM